jgi:hypothetical protein
MHVRCNSHLLTCWAARLQVSYLDKSPLAAIEAVSIMAGFGKQFATQHYLGREAVDVPTDFVEALLPGASALLQRLRSSNQQAQLRSEVDHSEVYFLEANVRLTQAFWRALPFKLQRYRRRRVPDGAAAGCQGGAVRPAVAGLPAAGAAAARGHGEAAHAALGADGGPYWPSPCSTWTAAWPRCLQRCSSPAYSSRRSSRSRSGCRVQLQPATDGATPAAGTAALSPSKRSTATAMPKLYSDKVATVQQAYQEYWWVSCKVLVMVMDACRQQLLLRLNTCSTIIHVHSP